MKVLQVYYKMPFPMHDGGACAIYAASLSLLNRGINLSILAMNPYKAPGKLELIPPDFIKETRLEFISVDNRIKPFKAFRRIFSHISYFSSRFYTLPFRNKLQEILNENEFDIIQLEHLYLCHYLEDIRKVTKTKVVLRAQNVEHRVWYEYIRKLRNPLIRQYLKVETRKLERFERQMAGKVDGIMALTTTDAEYFRRIAGRRKIAAIALGVDFTGISFTSDGGNYKNFPVFYHLGSMDWRPNIQGLTWFVEEVLPLVIKANANIRICIAGRNMPEWFFSRSSSNLKVDGVVEDAKKYQEDKQIMIVPLLSGSGIRFKILEGMSLGKTIITTSVGAQGIIAVDDESILIADDPDQFASQIIRCASSASFCREIGFNARKSAMKNYSIAHIGDQMVQFYQQLISSK